MLPPLPPEKKCWDAVFKELQKRADARANAEAAIQKQETVLASRRATVIMMEDLLNTLFEKKSEEERVLKETRETWESAREKAGFSATDEFQDSQMPADMRETLLEEMRKMEKEKISLAARREENEKTLLAERQEAVSEKTPEELFKEIEGLKNMRNENLRAQGEILEKIRKSREDEIRYAQENEKLVRQQAVREKWSVLHRLIGSESGNQFKNFAQYLTFTTLLRHGNHYLRMITDRYVLFPSEDEEKLDKMEILVQDNYQAGVVRTSRNLSGGETFLVSLALALALAGMAGKEVELDSLFLDEGFGSLDEETLETALDALAAVERSGKLIGVISHVSALQQRLSTQIKISPAGMGRSVISGPGVGRK